MTEPKTPPMPSDDTPLSSEPNAFLADLSRTLCHEMRGHGARVQSLVDIVEDTAGAAWDDDTRRRIGQIRDAGKSIVDLSADLSRFVQALGPPGVPERIDLGADIGPVFDEILAAHDVRGSLSVRGEMVVMAYRPHLMRVLSVLLDNAVKFRGETPLDVCVDVTKSGGSYVMRVMDSGRGIPARHAEHVFDPFAKTAELDGRANPGPGLGLTLARQLMRANGGSVAVEPSDAGTCIAVTWPVERPASGPSARAAPQ